MIWRRKKRPKRPSPSELIPPEGVPIHLPIAGLGGRIAAQVTDVLITVLGMVAVLILLYWSEIVAPQTIWAVGALMFFLIRVPYYVFTELAWNGQTLGKRLLKLKVVASDGGSLSTHALVLRNLVKEAEIFLPGTLLFTLDEAEPVYSLIALCWIVVVFTVPLSNKRRMRLGDIMAGTYVIRLPDPVLLSDLAAVAQAKRAKQPEFVFLPHQLDHYGAYELQTLEQVLRSGQKHLEPAAHENHKKTLATIVDKVRNKIEFAEAVRPSDHDAFLDAFYKAQRAHLEQKQLFGERRSDKHHGAGAQQN